MMIQYRDWMSKIRHLLFHRREVRAQILGGSPKHNLTKKVKLPGLPPGSWVSQKRHALLGDNTTETAT
jgi:hypothetical protein